MDRSLMIQRHYVYCNEGYMKTYAGLVGCVLDGDWNVPVPTCSGNQIIIVLKSTNKHPISYILFWR